MPVSDDGRCGLEGKHENKTFLGENQYGGIPQNLITNAVLLGILLIVSSDLILGSDLMYTVDCRI